MHTENFADMEELMADALSVRGFENYACNHYHLGEKHA
jgi:hypothetical protein